MSIRWIRGGSVLTPSGANLIDAIGGVTTFDVGTFNPVNYDARLAGLQARGYNAVRQFAWLPSAGAVAGGLNDAYMANVAAGVKLAYARGIYTIMSIDGVPNVGGYYPSPFPTGFGVVSQNWLILTSQGVLTATLALRDGLNALKSHGVTDDMLLAVEFTGEFGFTLDDAITPANGYPFNAVTGSFVTPSGTYTMPAQNQAMMDANSLRYINAMHTTAKGIFANTPTMVQLNPANMLVSADVSVPSAVICSTPAAMDAIGLSLYPETFSNVDIAFSTLIANLGAALPQSKYLTILEFGYTTGQTGTLATLAANLATQWIPTACTYGIYGYNFFTWDQSGFLGFHGMLDGNGEFASALSPHAIGDGCGGGNNADLAPILATNRVRAKFWAPGVAPESNPPTVTLTNVTDWRVVTSQANQFDNHQLTIAENDARIVQAMPNRTHCIIEHVGIGDIAWGIVEAPSQQVRATGEGSLVLDLPNVTSETLNVGTGMGYLAEGAIRDLIANLGAKRTKGRSQFTNPLVPYDAQNLAVTTAVQGRTTPWTATYIDDGTFMDATAPVVWDILGNCTADGNSITRAFGTTTPTYDGSGGSGSPVHVNAANHLCQMTWQIVVPTIARVGLRSDRAVGTPDYGFDFTAPGINPTTGLYQGTYQPLAGQAGTGSPGVYNSNTQFAVATFLSGGALSVKWLVDGQVVWQNAYNLPASFYPVAFIAALNGQVSNAQFTRNVPTSEAWYQLQFDKKSIQQALIQTATDIGQIVRQGANADGTPKRAYEFGKFGTSSGITLREGRGGLWDRLRVNPNIRLVQEITDYKVDSSNCYTVCTPLGGGGADAQIDLELLWRILYDVTYDHFQNRVGGYQNVFPEYDTSFSIWRDGENGAYEYYVVAEQAFAPVGYQYWMDNDTYTLPPDSLGYIDGGPTALSQFSYPNQGANLSQKEAVQRLLYVATIEQLKRAMTPHVTLQLTTIGDWRPPRAGDRIHIDYTRITTDKNTGNPFAPDRILTGTDPVTNPDPMILKWERAAGGDNIPIDTITLSNLGKYPDTIESQVGNLSQQVAAIQVSTQNKINASHLNISYENIDADHPVVVPCFFLNQTFSVDAFYFFVYTLPFSQPIAPEGNSDLYFNDPNTPIQLKVDGEDIPLKFIQDVNALTNTIGGAPTHFHHITIGDGQTNLVIPSTPYNAAPDRYVTLHGDGNPDDARNGGMQLRSTNHVGSIATDVDIHEVDLTPTTHPHVVATKGDIYIHIPTTTALGTLPQHYHPLPAGIKELSRPSGITLSIAGPDGVFVPVTTQLVDVLTNSAPGANGFASQMFMVEIARYMNWPGRIPMIRIESQKDANNGRGRVGWGGTIMENIGGIGFTAIAKQ